MMKNTRKILVCFLSVLMLATFSGCSLIPGILSNKKIETLKGWSFQYNKGTDDFSLFFGLLDDNDKFISADVDVDIRIVNDKDEEVYQATKSVSSSDFGDYTSQVAGTQFLAEIRIPKSDIGLGKSSNGTVYLTVYKENLVRFDEVNCSALYCLPVADIELIAEGLPVEIPVKNYSGGIQSKIKIETVRFIYETTTTPTLKITVDGIKTYGGATSSYDEISYKLYDSQNYVVESGQLFINSIAAGERFRDESICIYDITPGEIYRIVFSEHTW